MGIVSNVISEEGKIDISPQELTQKIANKVNETLEEKVFSPSFLFNGILLGINIIVFIIMKVII